MSCAEDLVDKSALDPVDYAVVSQALLSFASEMGAKLIRSAYSTIVREAGDASAALLDRDGNVIAQSELIPMQLGPMSETFRACAEVYPVSSLVEGDFYINNDPFQGGQHLQDVFIYYPIFHEGEIVGFSGTVAHHLDLGGGSAGMNTLAEDVHAEGIIFPPSKYNLENDWKDGPLRRLVAANVRVPSETVGDFDAQFAAALVGAHRVRGLYRKHGAKLVDQVMNEMLDYSERRVRASLSSVPDGTYFGEDWVDDDGIGDEPLLVKAKVQISGSEILIDFNGSCAQVARNLNCPLSSTLSAALGCVKAVLTDADIPFNDGIKRAVTVNVPEGTILNPVYPAPVRARMGAAYRAFGAVMKALSCVVPERVIAGGHDNATVLSISHRAEQKYKVYLEVFGGGYGASLERDGCDSIDSPLSNCSNAPVEALDMDFDHFRVVEYSLRESDCGAGRSRGGLGIVRRYAICRDEVSLGIYADRFKVRPYGLFGGEDGSLGECYIERNGEIQRLKSKDSVVLRRGDVLCLRTSGGGGAGPVEERERQLIELDREEGFFRFLD